MRIQLRELCVEVGVLALAIGCRRGNRGGVGGGVGILVGGWMGVRGGGGAGVGVRGGCLVGGGGGEVM